MIQARITMELARIVGKLANENPDAGNIEICWRDVDDERIWLIHIEEPNGETRSVYMVDDETGTHAPLTADELARVALDLPVLD
jgi:hypothetical protein